MRRRPSFDPHARLEIRRARTVGGVLRQLGPVGCRNGPRIGTGKRTAVSNEAYLCRRFVLLALETGRLGFPISVEHGDAPDFTIRHSGGTTRLEVTEACPQKDGHLFATQSGVQPIGNYSDTGTEAAVRDLRSQIQDAIDRKRIKPYAAQGTSLLIYPNSEAAQWAHFFVRDRPAPFLRELLIEPLDSVFIYWSDKEIFEVSASKEQAVLLGARPMRAQ